MRAVAGPNRRQAPDARPLTGYHGAGVLEVVGSHDGVADRAVYTLNFADAVYVLHAFKKKSKKGIAPPKRELDLIRGRLGWAQEEHAARTAAERNRP